MKSKNFILLFIFGLFLFLLPSLVKAGCLITCTDRANNCYWGHGSCIYYECYGTGERVGTIPSIAKREDIFEGQPTSYCSRSNGKCAVDVFPTGTNGQVCVARDRCWTFLAGCFDTDYSMSGVWDASDDDGSKCVTCNGKLEDRVVGYASKGKCADGDTNYGVCAHCGDQDGDVGNGFCESACGANAYLDEFTPSSCSTTQCGYGNTKRLDCADANCNPSDGACESTCGAASACDGRYPLESCSGGTCNNNCQCISAGCTIGGTPYDDGECNPSNKCQYCDIPKSPTSWSNVPSGKVCYNGSLVDVSDLSGRYCNYREDCSNGDCSASEWWTSCDGSGSCRIPSDQTDAYIEGVTASDGKVLTSHCSEVSPSQSYYCDYYENCSSGDCSADEYYRACNGSGSCRTNNTYAYHKDVYASAAHSLTSSCGTTGSTLCGSSYLPSSGPGNNHYGDGGSDSCQGMCDGSGHCDYAVNCSGTPNNPPACNAGSDKTVNENQSVQLDCSASDPDGDSLSYAWSCTGGSLNNSSILQPVYNAPSVGADTDYTCTLSVADGKGGNCSDSMVVHVKDVPAGPGINPPDVETVGYTNLTQTSITLNGYLYDLGGANSCLVWFEWGLTTSYGNSTTPVSMTAPGPFTAILSSLSSNKTYYFEAFARNGGSW